jgi:hypothetical protein
MVVHFRNGENPDRTLISTAVSQTGLGNVLRYLTLSVELRYLIDRLLIIDIIDTPLEGLFSDKNYKHINLLYYYYI